MTTYSGNFSGNNSVAGGPGEDASGTITLDVTSEGPDGLSGVMTMSLAAFTDDTSTSEVLRRR
jgi:hypothetical protein